MFSTPSSLQFYTYSEMASSSENSSNTRELFSNNLLNSFMEARNAHTYLMVLFSKSSDSVQPFLKVLKKPKIKKFLSKLAATWIDCTNDNLVSNIRQVLLMLQTFPCLFIVNPNGTVVETFLIPDEEEFLLKFQRLFDKHTKQKLLQELPPGMCQMDVSRVYAWVAYMQCEIDAYSKHTDNESGISILLPKLNVEQNRKCACICHGDGPSKGRNARSLEKTIVLNQADDTMFFLTFILPYGAQMTLQYPATHTFDKIRWDIEAHLLRHHVPLPAQMFPFQFVLVTTHGGAKYYRELQRGEYTVPIDSIIDVYRKDVRIELVPRVYIRSVMTGGPDEFKLKKLEAPSDETVAEVQC